MNTSHTDVDHPDFSTLTGIMEYFNNVPFETFKMELTKWFMKELPERRPDWTKANGDPALPESFEKLIESIFQIAKLKVPSNQK